MISHGAPPRCPPVLSSDLFQRRYAPDKSFAGVGMLGGGHLCCNSAILQFYRAVLPPKLLLHLLRGGPYMSKVEIF